MLVAAALIVLIAGGGLYLVTRSPQAVLPLSTPLPSTVAVVHSGPAQLVLGLAERGHRDADAEAPRHSGRHPRDARPIQGLSARLLAR